MKKIFNILTAFALTAVLSSCVGKTELPPYDNPWGDPSGNGTLESPFNCAAAVNKCVETGSVSNGERYFITGYVVGGEGVGLEYGNATYVLSDEPDGLGIFTIFHINGIDNNKFTADQTELVKVGDKVTVYAPIVLYGGSTPETDGGYLYSVNGDLLGKPMIVSEPAGEGTSASPFNVAGAIRKCNEIGTTASKKSYFITGYVVGGEGISVEYGNASFLLADNPESAGIFIAYRIKGPDNQKFTDAKMIKEGDKITIYAPLVNYRSSVPETNGGYVYAINDELVSTPLIDDHGQFPPVPEGDGTLEHPFNCAQAVEICKATGTNATAESYYVSGYVAGGDGIDTSYGNGTFLMADSYEGEGVFTAYHISDIDGVRFTDPKKVKRGDFITIYGRLVNYKDNTPETSTGARLVSFKSAEDF